MAGSRRRKESDTGQIWRNDSELELQAQAVADIYEKLQVDLLDLVIDRVTARGQADLERQPYMWQLEKMNQLHLLNRENVQLIAERSGVAIETLEQVIANEGLKIYEDTRQQLGEERQGATNTALQALTAYATQAKGELENLTNSTLPRSVRAVYQKIVEQTIAEVVIGAKTRDKALSDVIMRWSDKGFIGFVDKAGREWQAATYARAVIKTTTYSVYNEMRTQAAREAGVNTFLYSMKSAAREMCAPLQGRVVTFDPAFTAEDGTRVLSLSDYGHGTAGGCLGVHCGHYLTPYRVGINNIPERPEYLKDLTPEQAQENAKAEAKQRTLERNIRRDKQRLYVAEELGDAEHIQAERLRLRKHQAQLRTLIENHDFLVRDYSREKIWQ